MKKPNKLVAIFHSDKNKCDYVAQVKNISEEEYEKLFLTQKSVEQNLIGKMTEKEQFIQELYNKVLELEQEIKVLKGEE